ncbi:PGF-CTERM sorting domain-containing protein [Halomarina ordinaria]|uniref:PGF-CTERM sorting domain-containing protein n=1 Tax=Halomarina ordinaria TaxID=3033939 RepID=A0ABD5U898_9EURY|nr:PGF-CTERM sorting domain-containing protein [Halomarina sp. PSRA2]
MSETSTRGRGWLRGAVTVVLVLVVAGAVVPAVTTAASPHRYSGTVLYEDGSVAEGQVIEARHNGSVVAADVTDGDGEYALSVSPDDVAGNGSSVTLGVEGRTATVGWESGGETTADFVVPGAGGGDDGASNDSDATGNDTTDANGSDGAVTDGNATDAPAADERAGNDSSTDESATNDTGDANEPDETDDAAANGSTDGADDEADANGTGSNDTATEPNRSTSGDEAAEGTENASGPDVERADDEESSAEGPGFTVGAALAAALLAGALLARRR